VIEALTPQGIFNLCKSFFRPKDQKTNYRNCKAPLKKKTI